MPSIWCDGRFKEFQAINNSDLSTDGFPEIIKADANATLISTPGEEVQKKWSKMFQVAGELGYTYAFLFGCDEHPVGDFDSILDALPQHDGDAPRIFRVMMLEKGKQGFWKDYDGPKERLFFRPDLIEVKESHWAFFDKTMIDGYPLLSPPNAEKGLIFYHDNQLRDPARDALMGEYQKRRVPGERKRTMESIMATASNRHLTTAILRDLYPQCEIKAEENFEGRQQFKVLGKADPSIIRRDYQSYVILPFEGADGLFIRKARVAIPNRFNTFKDDLTVVG